MYSFISLIAIFSCSRGRVEQQFEHMGWQQRLWVAADRAQHMQAVAAVRLRSVEDY